MFRFVYSSHKSRNAAELALDDYYSSGDVSDSDSPVIVFDRGPLARHGARLTPSMDTETKR